MFNSRKLSFSIFSDDSDVYIVVSVGNWGERVAKINIGIQIQVFIEFVVVVVLGEYTFFRDHDSQQYTFVTFEQISLLNVLKSKIIDYIEAYGDISSFKNINNWLWVDMNLRVI